MNTFTKLYLGAEPVSVTVQDDQLCVVLDDGREVDIPLQLVSQCNTEESFPEGTQLLILRHPPQIEHVYVTDDALKVYLKDGRLISCPLSWFPRLLYGTVAERAHYILSGDDDVIHWPLLDEDIELSRLLEGGRSLKSERSLQHWLMSRQAETSAAYSVA